MTATTDRVRMGFIGVGNRGTQLLQLFLAEPAADVVALCDVYEPYVQRDRSQVHPRFLQSRIPVPAMDERFEHPVDRYTDFRDLLARKDIDAVCIATPDHWHAAQTVLAFEAGKDVYVEKPLTATVVEGRRMVEAGKRTGRIGAVGLNRRGSTIFRRLVAKIHGGAIGRVVSARAFRISNMSPAGIGKLPVEPPPPGLDWDRWLGPRAAAPYHYNIAPYGFRWHQDYSSQMGNWGVHYMDAIRWLTGDTAPVAVSAIGRKTIDDDRTIPDTLLAVFEMPSGVLVQFEVHEATDGEGVRGGDVELRGTLGNLVANESAYRITPARPGQMQTWRDPIPAEQSEIAGDQRYGDLGTKEDSTANLVRDFLACVKSRQTPLCTLEDGHRSTCFALLANTALAVGGRLEWDAEHERFRNSDAANARLHYEYRAPWRL